MQMLKEIAIVRWNAFLGRYDKPVEDVRRTDPMHHNGK
jgi:hypothetical protein